MAASPDETALLLEFDVLAARAGLEIPPDRKPGLLQGFKDLRQMLSLIRQPRTAAAEPAGTYCLDTVTRSL
jgi:hypothetical protein